MPAIPSPMPRPGLGTHIDVDDLDVYSKRFEAAGGKIVVPKTGVPGVGWLLLFSDPDDRVIGVWKQNPQT